MAKVVRHVNWSLWQQVTNALMKQTVDGSAGGAPDSEYRLGEVFRDQIVPELHTKG